MTKFLSNSSWYSFSQNDEHWDPNFDLVIRNIKLSDEILSASCCFKIFDQITLKEVGKIEFPFKKLLSLNGDIKTQSLFFDLNSELVPGIKAILHLKTLKKASENNNYHNYDTYLKYFVASNNLLIDPIYNYSLDLNIDLKTHLKILQKIFDKMYPEMLIVPINDFTNFSANYASIKYQYFSLFLNKNSQSIAMSNINLTEWRNFLEELKSFQAALLLENKEKQEFAAEPKIIKNSENHDFIERESFNQNQKSNIEMNKFSMFSNIFYQIHEWQKTKNGSWFYQNLQKLCKEGIPFALRESVWLEFGKIKKMIYQAETFLGFEKDKENSKNNEADQKKIIYQFLFAKAKHHESLNLIEFFEDLDELADNSCYNLTIHEITLLKNVFQTVIYWKGLLKEKKFLYSKDLIPIVIKIIRFYNAENMGIIEENIFWIFLTLFNNVLRNYFSVNSQNENCFLTLNQNGIKADLAIFEVLIQDHLPELYKKIKEFGLPLIYYFSKHFLSLFSDLFNEEMCFRLWDILLFESGAGEQVKFIF